MGCAEPGGARMIAELSAATPMPLFAPGDDTLLLAALLGAIAAAGILVDRLTDTLQGCRERRRRRDGGDR